MPSKQAVTIGKKSFPVSYGIDGPTITGNFTPEEKRYIISVYGVKVVSPSKPTKVQARN